MKCTVCTHPQLHAIDGDILAGNGTLAALSQKYGPSPSALWRHKEHLQEKMVRSEARLQDHLRQGYLFKLNTYLEVSERALKTADADGNSRLALQAARESHRLIKSMNKLQVELDQNTVYLLLASPQWFSPGGLLPAAPEFLDAARRTLADSLFFPCPETTPELENDDADAAAVAAETPAPHPRDARDSKLEPVPEKLPPGLTPALLQQILPRLFESPDPQEIARNRPKNQREISAKFAANTPPSEDISRQYQRDMLGEKITAKNPI